MESESFSGWRTMTETSAPAFRSCCKACLPMFPVGVVITIDICLLLRRSTTKKRRRRRKNRKNLRTLRFFVVDLDCFSRVAHCDMNDSVTILLTNGGENIITWAEFLCEIRRILCLIVQFEFAMDALTEVLNSVRVRSTVYCPVEIGAPWGLHVAKEIGAPFFILVKGAAFLVIEELNIRQYLEAGDFIIITKRCACEVSDSPQSEIIDLQEWLRLQPPGVDGTYKVEGEGEVTKFIDGTFFF